MSSTLSVKGVPKDEPAPPEWWANPNRDVGAYLWYNSNFKDFQIIVGDRVLGVHKCVLAVRSPVFAAMLTSGLTETQTGQMDIKDFDYATVIRAIQFCYCPGLFLGANASSIWNLLTFGHKYDIQHIVKAWLYQLKLSKNSYDDSEIKFLITSAVILGCNAITDQILSIFGAIKGPAEPEHVSNFCPYPALDDALAREEYFKDMKIICDEDGTEFSVHKFILAFRSPVFARIFEKMTQDGDTSGQLKIDQISPMVLKAAVQFFYTRTIPDEALQNLNLDLLLGLLGFADRFQVQELVTSCLQIIDGFKNTIGKEMISNCIQTAVYFDSKKIFHFILGIFGTLGFDPFDCIKYSRESYWN